MEKISIMLNTCDKFSDLWPLFFDCLYKFWNPKYNIYINSESLNYCDKRFNIISIPQQNKCSWSDRLYNCIKKIDSKYIICIEEECLVEENVDISNVNKAIKMLDDNDDIACIHLMHIPGEKINNEKFLPFVERKYDYRNLISQQVCIWNKEKWLHYIKPNENPWEYECLSSARGIVGNDRFFAVADDVNEVVKYGYGYIVYRGCFIKAELERLEHKLGLKFDKNARPIKTKEQIDKETNKDILFYNRLRIKKIIILFNKYLENLFRKKYECCCCILL